MRASTSTLLLALPLLTTATFLTPLLATRFIPQQILVNFSPLSHPCTAYSSTDIACGLLCLPSGYTCCPDKLGGCAGGESCVRGDNGVFGCCVEGGKCTGDGVVGGGGEGTGTGTSTGKETGSKTTVTSAETTKTSTGESSTETESSSTDAKTTSAETTGTDKQPTPTATGGAAGYGAGAGSMGGVVGAVVVGLFVL